MAKVEFLGPIGLESIDVDIKSLKELKDVFATNEEVQKWLDICSIAVNDTLVNSLETPINQNDKISLLPPVCGG